MGAEKTKKKPAEPADSDKAAPAPHPNHVAQKHAENLAAFFSKYGNSGGGFMILRGKKKGEK